MIPDDEDVLSLPLLLFSSRLTSGDLSDDDDDEDLVSSDEDTDYPSDEEENGTAPDSRYIVFRPDDNICSSIQYKEDRANKKVSTGSARSLTPHSRTHRTGGSDGNGTYSLSLAVAGCGSIRLSTS